MDLGYSLDFTTKKVKQLQDDLDKAKAAAAAIVDLEAKLEMAKAAADETEVLKSEAIAKANEKKARQEENKKKTDRRREKAAQDKKEREEKEEDNKRKKKKKKEENEKEEAEKKKKKEEDERVQPGERLVHDDETEAELDNWEVLRQRKWWQQASALRKTLEAKGIDPWQSRPEAPERTDKDGKEDLNPNLDP